MRGNAYYTLLASLPPLPRFDRAERLPITRERLQQRLKMLGEQDSLTLERAAAFLTWQKDARHLTDQAMADRFEEMKKAVTDSALWGLFAFALDQRTIMVALRRKHQGRPTPSGKEPWGVGPYVGHMERNWDRPHFALSDVYPWIVQAETYLENEDVLNLDRLLKNVLWDHLDRVVPPYDFGFRAVMSYRIKWDMVDQWLSHDVQKAGERFDELVEEIINGEPKLFH